MFPFTEYVSWLMAWLLSDKFRLGFEKYELYNLDVQEQKLGSENFENLPADLEGLSEAYGAGRRLIRSEIFVSFHFCDFQNGISMLSWCYRRSWFSIALNKNNIYR